MASARHRFACTQCGKCCNRSPEIELSEAAPLADVFVFRLMFRLYRLPRTLADYRRLAPGAAEGSEAFHQRKRLLGGYAARQHLRRGAHEGRPVEQVEYLVISALTLDTGGGACSALESDGRCGIYERRPYACRTVPLHYTAVEATAESELAAFVATPGYRCETGERAPVLLDRGRIIDPGLASARREALAAAARDAPWKQAIVRRMKAPPDGRVRLPSLREVEANAAHGAMTTSMRAGWLIAVDAGLLEAAVARTLIAAQRAAIERELAAGRAGPDARQTLLEMREEYRPRV